jgi:hypothetical protein
MRKLIVASVVIALGWAMLAVTGGAQDDQKATTKEVMKVAMKGKLYDKVAKGTATEQEKKQLAGLFAALHSNKPPKGEQSSWDTKTKALVDAANDVLANKPGAGDALAKAADCMGCHMAHRGK